MGGDDGFLPGDVGRTMVGAAGPSELEDFADGGLRAIFGFGGFPLPGPCRGRQKTEFDCKNIFSFYLSSSPTTDGRYYTSHLTYSCMMFAILDILNTTELTV